MQNMYNYSYINMTSKVKVTKNMTLIGTKVVNKTNYINLKRFQFEIFNYSKMNFMELKKKYINNFAKLF